MPIVQKAALPRERRQAFETLHAKRMLGSHETVSGRGSRLMATRNLRNFLTFLMEIGIFDSLLDVGCGDFNWMSVMDLQRIRYTGIDIVNDIVETNRKHYGNDRVRFMLADIVEHVPPPHDLVICKDVLNHLSSADVVHAFNNIKRSGAKYFLASGTEMDLLQPSMHELYRKNINGDIPPGYWRALDLRRAPFYFPNPLWTIEDNHAGKTFDIWAFDALPYLNVEAIALPPVHNPYSIEDFKQFAFFRALCALPFIQKIALYGSRAAGTHQPGADIEMMLWCAPRTTREQWLQVCHIIYTADIILSIHCLRYADTLASAFTDFEKLDFRILYERGH